MSIDLQRAIDDFWAARQKGGRYPIEYGRVLTQTDANRINLALIERHAARGEVQAGWKVGLTTSTIRKHLGIPEPVFGCLFKDGRWSSGETWQLKTMREPGFENELCINLGERLEGPGVTFKHARRSIKSVAPAIEIIERRGPSTHDGIMTMMADNAQQYAFIVGPEVQFDPQIHDLSEASVEVYIDRVFRERAFGNAVMESSPIASLAWLANKLAEYGRALEPGQSVMTGSFTRQYTLDRPMLVEARFAPFGSVIANFI